MAKRSISLYVLVVSVVALIALVAIFSFETGRRFEAKTLAAERLIAHARFIEKNESDIRSLGGVGLERALWMRIAEAGRFRDGRERQKDSDLDVALTYARLFNLAQEQPPRERGEQFLREISIICAQSGSPNCNAKSIFEILNRLPK